MKDRLDSRRKAAAAMMGGGGPRSNLAMEMGGIDKPAPRVLSRGPADVYKRPTGKEAGSEYARGGKVKKAAAKATAPRGMVARMMRRDERTDKKQTAKMIGKHEAHLHKGEPRTKFAKGGKVKCLAAGGAAKIRKGMAKPVPKSPRGGNPQY